MKPEVVTLETEQVRVKVAPEVGARIVSFIDRRTGYEFLWRNAKVPLRREAPGAPYDPNFYGGIDELFPNDIPENIAGVDCSDHGELWTTSFEVVRADRHSIILRGTLPRYGFGVYRELRVDDANCHVSTTFTNLADASRPYLWKLHAALAIAPGDRIEVEADRYLSADPTWSRRGGEGVWQGEIVPQFDGTTEFLYLHPLRRGWMSWSRKRRQFSVQFDRQIFPYAWYFASYGGFDGHRVAILEPCTCMPISVNEALGLGQCPVLGPGESMASRYTFRGVDES